MSVNDNQVGGAHYKTVSSERMHWDMVIDINLPYTLGCATKYLYRWRDKNGVQDLKKALHYLEKTSERFECIECQYGDTIDIVKGIPATVGKEEQAICCLAISSVLIPGNMRNLDMAIVRLKAFIQAQEATMETDVYLPIAHAEGARRVSLEEVQPTASQLHPL